MNENIHKYGIHQYADDTINTIIRTETTSYKQILIHDYTNAHGLKLNGKKQSSQYLDPTLKIRMIVVGEMIRNSN